MDAWRDCISADLCTRKGFRGGPFLDYVGSMQLLVSSHVGAETRRCSEGSFAGEFGTVFSLARCEEKTFLVVFVVGSMGMGICFGNVHFPPLVHVRESPEFSSIVVSTKLTGLGVSFGMVGYLLFLVVGEALPGQMMLLMLLKTN